MFQFLADETTKGLPLTLFSSPKAWKRWRRTSNVLIDPNLLSRTTEIQMVSDYLKADGTFIANSLTEVISTTNGVYSPAIEDPNTGTPDNAKYIEVRYETTAGNIEVLERQRYELQDSCAKPILIEWVNELGGFEQYVFDYSQDIQILTEAGIRAEKGIVQDFADVTETKIRVADDWTQSILVQVDNLTTNELYALNDILKSTSVRILLDRAGNTAIKCVIANTFSTQYTTSDARHTFTMQLELPNNVNVYELIDYEAAILGAHQEIAFTDGFN